MEITFGPTIKATPEEIAEWQKLTMGNCFMSGIDLLGMFARHAQAMQIRVPSTAPELAPPSSKKSAAPPDYSNWPYPARNR